MTDIYLYYDALKHSSYRGVPTDQVRDFDPLQNFTPESSPHRSLYSYQREKIVEYDAKKTLPGGQPSLSGFSGGAYGAESLWFDLDNSVLVQAAASASRLSKQLSLLDCPHHIWFSGKKGFHIEIPAPVWNHDQFAYINKKVFGRIARLAKIEEDWDSSVYGRNAKIRTVHGPRENKCHKIWVPKREYLRDVDGIIRQSKKKPSLSDLPSEPISEKRLPDILDGWFAKVRNQLENKPPVTFHRGKSSRYIGGTAKNANELVSKVVAAQKGQRVSEGWSIRCIHPHHNDKNPSAIIFPNGVFHCRKCGNSSPSDVADLFGVELEWEKEEWDADEDDKEKEDTDLSEFYQDLKDVINSAYETNENLVLKVSMGGGKSHAIRELCDEKGITMAYLTPTHELAHEALQHIEGDHLKPVYELEPRCEDQKIDPSESWFPIKNNTSRMQEGLLRQERGSGFLSVCFSCPIKNECKGWKRREEVFEGRTEQVPDPLSLGTKEVQIKEHAYAAQANLGIERNEAGLFSGRDIAVIDEGPIPWLAEVQTFSLKDLMPLRDGTIQVDWKRVYKDLNVAAKGYDEEAGVAELKDAYRRLFEHGDMYSFLDLIEDPNDRWSVMFDGMRAIGRCVLKNIRAKKGEGEYEIGFEAYFEEYPEAESFMKMFQAGINAVQKVEDHKGQSHLLVKRVKETHVPENMPVVILDATASEDDVRFYEWAFDREFRFVEKTAYNSGTTVKQIPTRSWSGKQQRLYVQEMEEEGTNHQIEALVDRIEANSGPVAVISQKQSAVKDWLIANDIIPKHLTAHFGALRGLDRFHSCGNPASLLIVLGDPAPNGLAYDVEMMRWNVSREIHHQRRRKHIDFSEGYHCTYYTVNFPANRPVSKIGERIWKQVITNAMIQAAGRIRGLRRDVEIEIWGYPFTKLEEHPYEAISGPKVSVTGDPSLLYGLLLKTFASQAEISRRTGISKRQVKKLLTDEVKSCRKQFAQDLLDDGMSKTDTAEKMLTSRPTLNKKLKT